MKKVQINLCPIIALSKRYKLLKIFMIYCDSCDNSAQASVRRISDSRTLSNIPFVLEIIVNAF